jgi:alpha-1,2-mannosyltransferase
VRARSSWAPVLVLVAAAAVAGALRGGLTDLLVYRYGAGELLHGLPLYESRDPVTGLHFTYPPFAAVLLAPLALVPSWLAAGLWTGTSAAALAATVVVVRRALGRTTPAWLVAVLAAGALALEPVWQDLTFGQVNLFLMLAVLVDLQRPGRRWSGVLVGIAAGVKLTPLVFIALLVLVRRPRDAGRAAVAFAGTVAVGFVAAPGSAAAYWTHGLVDASRVGPPALAHNQSVYGALARLLGAPAPAWLWLVVATPLSVAIVLVAATWWRRGDRMLAACLGGLAMLVASPISWSHHWVWAVPVALVLWERSRPVCLAWIAVFVTRPVLWPPWGQGREHAWGPLDHVLGNAYLLAALLVTVWAATRLRATRRVPQLPIRVRTSNSSGKNVRSSALRRKSTPEEPPVPALWPMVRWTTWRWRKRHSWKLSSMSTSSSHVS